jgi:hypothetical protein
MRKTFRRFGKAFKGRVMFAGGWGRYGPYAYTGYKKGKTSVGGSIGTLGRQVYGSHRRGGRTLKARYNLDSKSPRIRMTRLRRQYRR